MPTEITPPRISSNMAPSQPIAGEEIQAGGREKTEAGHDKDNIEHCEAPKARGAGYRAPTNNETPPLLFGASACVSLLHIDSDNVQPARQDSIGKSALPRNIPIKIDGRNAPRAPK